MAGNDLTPSHRDAGADPTRGQTIEPPRDLTVAHRRFEQQLIESARLAIDRAFQLDEKSEWRAFVLEAAAGLELLAKAVLFQVNPVLIADIRHEPSILALALGSESLSDGRLLRTISADRALERAKQVGIRIDSYGEDLKAIREVRNAVAHVGAFNEEETRAAFNGWLRTLVALTDGVRWHHRRVFGRHAPTVEKYLEGYESEAQAFFDRRLAAARSRWEVDQQWRTEAKTESMRKTLESEFLLDNESDPSIQFVACPVCQLPAALTGELRIEPEYDRDGENFYVNVSSWKYEAEGLRCRTCGLNLDSPDLVERSKALTDWELDEDDWAEWVQLINEDNLIYEQH